MTEKFKTERIDLPCGCVLEWANELGEGHGYWVVSSFCEEHDPTIKRD